MVILKEEWLVAFHSTHHAIAAEHLAKASGWAMEMIPTPRDISASCGLSLRFTDATAVDQETVTRKLKEYNIVWAGIYFARKNTEGQKSWQLQ